MTSHPRTKVLTIALLVSVTSALFACGPSSDERERREAARQAAMQKAIADSAAEEREKDRRMREAASAQADERLARDAAQDANEAAAKAAREAPQKEVADALRHFNDKLRQSVPDPASLQVRNAEMSPNGKGMCAEFSARDKSGNMSAFKRVVVTDQRAAVEELPLRETMTQFLLFQLAARDTGCFPDVQGVRILQ